RTLPRTGALQRHVDRLPVRCAALRCRGTGAVRMARLRDRILVAGRGLRHGGGRHCPGLVVLHARDGARRHRRRPARPSRTTAPERTHGPLTQNRRTNGSQMTTNRPNIVLILTDDMGFSDIGCFGGEVETPQIDRLAAGGAALTQFYNTARCSPSRASLLTGLHPHQTGIGILNYDDSPEGYPGD